MKKKIRKHSVVINLAVYVIIGLLTAL